MNTRRVKRQISANEEPPPPPKRQATGKPVSVSPTPLPKPKRTSKKTAANQGGRMTAVKGRAGAPRMTAVNGRPGAFMEPGKKQVGRKQGDNWQPPANAFNMGTRIAEAEAEAAATLAGMAGMGAPPPAVQPAPTGNPINQPPIRTSLPDGRPLPPSDPLQPPTRTPLPAGRPQPPFLAAFLPERRFKGPNPIQVAKTTFQGKQPIRYPPLGTRLVSVKDFEGWEDSGVFEDVQDEDRAGMKSIDETHMTFVQQRQWLDSEKIWYWRLGGEWREEKGTRWFIPEWEGKRLLGMGGNGIVGLWERIEAPEPMEGQGNRVIPEHVNRVAVKQQKPGHIETFREECQYMEKLRGRGKHLIHMYDYSLNERGQGTYEGNGKGLDPLNAQVQRVFLDYCDGGNFEDFSYEYYKKYSAESPCPERLVWKVFQCLAQACCVFENGNEASLGYIEFDDPKIVHFDLKLENVFVKTDDSEHDETPLLVIGDFGHMEWINKPPMEKGFYEYNKVTGTRIAFPPEQYEEDLEDTFGIPEYLGIPINIWAIGKIMYHFITRGREPNPEAYTYQEDDGTVTEQQPYEYLFAQLNDQDPNSWLLTQGVLLLNAPYSHMLRTLVLQCLALDWRHRPSARQILNVIERALGIVRQVEAQADATDVDRMDAELDEFAEANKMDLDSCEMARWSFEETK